MSGKPASEKDPEVVGVAPGKRPQMPLWVMWRLVVGGLATVVLVIALIVGLLTALGPGGQGTMTSPDLSGLAIELCLWALVALAVICAPLFLVVYGFGRQRKWAGDLALFQDFVLVTASAFMLALSLGDFTTTGGDSAGLRAWTAAVGAFGLLLAAEASHLLRGAWVRRLVWPAFGIVAAGLLATGLAVPPLVMQRLVRHVRPLRGYIQGHWFAIPPGSRISVELAGASGADFASHRDYVYVETGKVAWEVQADHQARGRWRVPVDPQSSFPEDLMVFRGRVLGWGDVRSVSAARQLLQDAGVRDRDLRPESLGVGKTRFGLPRALADGPGFPREYLLWSPRGHGLYRVREDGEISFLVERRLEVP